MSPTSRLGLVVLLAMLLFGLGAEGQTVLLSESFDGASLPAGFTVVSGGATVSGGRLTLASGAVQLPGSYSRATGLRIEADVSIQSGTHGDFNILAFHDGFDGAHPFPNGYEAGYHPVGSDNPEDFILAVIGGTPAVIARTPTSIATGTWVRVKFELLPTGVLRTEINGVERLSATSNAFSSGSLMIRSHFNVLVDNLLVTTDVATTPPTQGGGTYNFDEGAGTTAADSSGAGNHGTVVGSATWVEGYRGSALLFSDATSAVNLPQSVWNGFGNTVYTEAWIYPNRDGQCSAAGTIVRKRAPFNDFYMVFSEGNQLDCVLAKNGTTTGAAIRAGSIPVNAWSKVACWYDGATMRGYVNNELVGEHTLEFVPDWESGYVGTEIGNNTTDGYCGTVAYNFPGIIDEVVISTAPPAGSCSLSCNASVPTTAAPGQLIAFSATANPVNCAGSATYSWNFGDGQTGSGPNVNHAYGSAGTYSWQLTVSIDGVTCTKSGTISITAIPPACSLSCTASAPGSGTPGQSITFSATSTPSNCTGTPTYAWTFGDGQTASGPNVTHTYATAGTYSWQMTATVDGKTCTKTGTITISPPAPSQRELFITIDGSGRGQVTSPSPSISCANSCSGYFADGTTITLTATPATGSVFIGWGGACTGTGNCTVTLTSSRGVRATFNATTAANHSLTISRTGTGAGTVTSSPSGIACGATCSASFAPGTLVTLTASAASGSTFSGWSGACSGTAACVVSITQSRSVVAAFVMGGVSAPTADFVYSPTNPTAGEPVSFEYTGSGASRWYWDLNGDGLTDSKLQHPTYSYPLSSTVRSYSATLKVKNSAGETATVKRSVRVEPFTESAQNWSFIATDPNPNCVRAADGSVEPSQTLYAPCGTRVSGAAADGVTKVLLYALTRSPGSITFGLTDSSGGDGWLSPPSDTSQRAYNLTVSTAGAYPFGESPYVASVVWTVPAEFSRPGRAEDRTSKTRKVEVSAEFRPTAGTVVEPNRVMQLDLERPPVLLVHGLWSSAAKIANFPLTKERSLEVRLVDYEKTNADSFESNINVVGKAAKDAKDRRRMQGKAISQVDIVAHSMGGILSRFWASVQNGVRFMPYKRLDNHFMGDIRKLITIDTPHLGSEMATVLVAQKQQNSKVAKMIEKHSGPISEAVQDLRPGSPALALMQPGTSPPTHALAGGVKQSYGTCHDQPSTFVPCECPEANGTVLGPYASTLDPVEFGVLDPSKVFSGRDHDFIVSLESQRGGIASHATSPPFKIWQGIHTCNMTSYATDYSQRVLELLDTPIPQAFAQPATVTASTLPTASTEKSVASSLQGLQIYIPLPLVGQGDEVVAQVLQTAGPSASIVYLVGMNLLVEDSEPPFEFTFQLPITASPGEFELTAIGVVDDDTWLFSSPATITLAMTESPNELSTAEDWVIFWGFAGQERPIRVWGSYRDGSTRDLTNSSTGTIYTSLNPGVADVSIDGVITPRSFGETEIVVENQETTTSVLVTVVKPDVPPRRRPIRP